MEEIIEKPIETHVTVDKIVEVPQVIKTYRLQVTELVEEEVVEIPKKIIIQEIVERDVVKILRVSCCVPEKGVPRISISFCEKSTRERTGLIFLVGERRVWEKGACCLGEGGVLFGRRGVSCSAGKGGCPSCPFWQKCRRGPVWFFAKTQKVEQFVVYFLLDN